MGPFEDSVIKNKNENGLHVFTINLDVNANGNGVSPWSIVEIVVLIILVLAVIKKLKDCCTHYNKHRPTLLFSIETRKERDSDRYLDQERKHKAQEDFVNSARLMQA